MVDLKKNARLIFIPSQGISHLVAVMEFAQILINRANHLSITVLSFKYPNYLLSHSDSYIESVLASIPQIHLIHLPQVEPPPQELLKSIPSFMWTFMESLKPHVKSTMQSILSSCSDQVVGLVLDFFCSSMVDVGNELGIPSYLFMTSNVGFLSFMLSLQVENLSNDSDAEVLIPGFSCPVPSNVLPTGSSKKDGSFVALCKFAQRYRQTKGFIVNTFLELEKYAIDALSDGQTPPIYAIGPLLDVKGQPNPNLDQNQHDKILKWLNEQPPSSVVFLCFGSYGSFDPIQTREIALALEHSGVRFLWAIRSSTTDKAEKTLPKEFLEWMEMEGRGMLCEWAPQVEVLAHRAIGGFVSHCGWNSILESLWFGVPILTWPIYAEQQLNAFKMVRELGLAVELRLDYRRGDALVMAEDIEKGLKELMDKDNMVHRKVKEMKEIVRKAGLSGGSSFLSAGKLIDDIMTGTK